MGRREERAERGLEPSPDGPVAHVAFLASPSRRDPQTVRLECDFGTAEGEGGDGSGDVRTYSGELLELGERGRESAAVVPNDPPGGLVKAVGPGVIAGAFPNLEDATERRAREDVDRRERVHEPFEVGNGLRDARLLKKDLGDPDPVGIAVGAPGERSPLKVIPTEQGPCELRGRGLRDRR